MGNSDQSSDGKAPKNLHRQKSLRTPRSLSATIQPPAPTEYLEVPFLTPAIVGSPAYRKVFRPFALYRFHAGHTTGLQHLIGLLDEEDSRHGVTGPWWVSLCAPWTIRGDCPFLPLPNLLQRISKCFQKATTANSLSAAAGEGCLLSLGEHVMGGGVGRTAWPASLRQCCAAVLPKIHTCMNLDPCWKTNLCLLPC